MKILEKCYSIWKKLKKNLISFYKAYFTIEGTYTSLLPDKVYLKKKYKSIFNKELNLKNPKTFNEKMQWIKLYDRNPLYTTLVDKFKVREYVKERIGEEYLIPLIGVWDNPYDINFDELPNQFVLKCNHDSNVFICKDKSICDIRDKKYTYSNYDEVREALEKRLKINYYKANREWPYKNVHRKIICEKYMEDKNSDSLVDYKFSCFNGEPRFLYITKHIESEEYINYFDDQFNSISVYREDLPSMQSDYYKQPRSFEKMKKICKKLTKGLTWVRCDLYEINNKVFFGELTFFPTSGFVPFTSEKWNIVFGDYIELKRK